MLNKLVLPIVISIQFGAIAQTNSPYSNAGIGERSNLSHPVFSGMGNQFVSYSSPSVLNTYNPASYSFLRHQFPIFSVGFSSRLSYYNQDGAKEFGSYSNISDIAFGLSFAKRFGLAFGLKPLYRKSYSFTEKTMLLADSIKYTYEGKGLINKGYVGFSVKILNFDSLQWSVGGNVGGIFGTMTDERRSAIQSTANNVGGGDIRAQQLRSFHYELGTMLQWQIRNGHKIVFGGTFEPEQHIKSVYNKQLFYSSTDIDNQNTWIVLSESGEKKGKVAFAPSYNVGASYSKTFRVTKKDGNIRNSQIMVSAGYSATDWSKYRENYSDTSFSYGLKSASGFQAGFQYIPETMYVGNAMPKFFERTSYRLGFYNSTLPYVYNNSQLTEWAATIGFGFPMLVERRLDSSIQLSIGAGQRGATAAGSLNETFVTVSLGLLIAPSLSDRWFVKRKLD